MKRKEFLENTILNLNDEKYNILHWLAILRTADACTSFGMVCGSWNSCLGLSVCVLHLQKFTICHCNRVLYCDSDCILEDPYIPSQRRIAERNRTVRRSGFCRSYFCSQKIKKSNGRIQLDFLSKYGIIPFIEKRKDDFIETQKEKRNSCRIWWWENHNCH